MFNKITTVKQLSLATILILSINGCGSDSSTSIDTSNQESITIVPADGYIYGASMDCSSGATATLGADNLTFTVNSLDPGTCEINGGYHIVDGEEIPNDTSLEVIVDSAENGDKLYATPLTTLVSASVKTGEDRDSARKKVTSLMGLDPSNSDDVDTLLKADPTKLDKLSFSKENKNFDPATARSSMVSVYTMMEQFDNAAVDENDMRTALKNIVDKGSNTQPREELNVSTLIEAIDSTLNTGKHKEQFAKIEDLLGTQEQMLREIPDSDFNRLEDTIANTIKISQELEETITDTISQEVNPITPNSPNRAYAIVDTAQSSCYDSTSGSQINCTDTGYDADYSGNQPTYTLSSSRNIVTDNVTSLMWTQSSDIDNDGETTDADDKLSYDDSITYCRNLNVDGYSDWRLPDIKTLYSLILFSGEDPSNYRGTDTSSLVTFLDSSFDKAFGDLDAGERIIDGQYATSTKYVSTTMNGDETIFGVNFVDGRIKGYPTSFHGGDKEFYLLCTRGNEDYGQNNFTDNGDKTITDNATALMWQQDDTQSTDFENAISICEDATTAGHTNWRLPNVKELQSIVDYTKSPDSTNSAAIDSLFNATSFTNEDGVNDWGYYWSSTTHISNGGSGENGSYVSFGRALGVMDNMVMDVHGSGAQRSNAKQSENSAGSSSSTDINDGSIYYYKGPQGDILRTDNMVRCVRDDNKE